MTTVLTAPYWKKIPYNDRNLSSVIELEKTSNAVKFAIVPLEQIYKT